MIEETSDLIPADESLAQLVQDVMAETDVDKTKDLIALFNWNLAKKNVARVHKLNNLFDNVTDQMVKRFQYKPDQFSNDDLLNYMKAVQGAIDNSSKVIEGADEPPKIINNTQINVTMNSETFDRDARARILAAVQATLAAAQELPVEYEDKTIIESEDTSNE